MGERVGCSGDGLRLSCQVVIVAGKTLAPKGRKMSELTKKGARVPALGIYVISHGCF